MGVGEKSLRQPSSGDADAWTRQETSSLLVFRQGFFLVSASNRTTGSLATAAAEPCASRSCASLWDLPQPYKHPHHNHEKLGVKPVPGT